MPWRPGVNARDVDVQVEHAGRILGQASPADGLPGAADDPRLGVARPGRRRRDAATPARQSQQGEPDERPGESMSRRLVNP